MCVYVSSRPDSAEGYLSPCQSVSRNGENWENESTTSSVASNTEYTGTISSVVNLPDLLHDDGTQRALVQ